jgi:hypothetical protein
VRQLTDAAPAQPHLDPALAPVPARLDPAEREVGDDPAGRARRRRVLREDVLVVLLVGDGHVPPGVEQDGGGHAGVACPGTRRHAVSEFAGSEYRVHR